LKDEITALASKPCLVGFLANDDAAAKKYAEWTANSCREVGIEFKLVECARTDLEDRIVEANNDSAVHGIMVYYPVFSGAQDQYLQNTVSVSKDVEGLCHQYRS
jgi:methylenetetrahydrofolate dehydrogenase (NAD+)